MDCSGRYLVKVSRVGKRTKYFELHAADLEDAWRKAIATVKQRANKRKGLKVCLEVVKCYENHRTLAECDCRLRYASEWRKEVVWVLHPPLARSKARSFSRWYKKWHKALCKRCGNIVEVMTLGIYIDEYGIVRRKQWLTNYLMSRLPPAWAQCGYCKMVWSVWY